MWLRSITVLAAVVLAAGTVCGAQLDVLDVPGVILRDNPLGDPAARHVAVFKPDGLPDTKPAILVVYLPGWGGSSEDAIAQGRSDWYARVIDQCASSTPVRIAVVDGRSRYGGSQYLNSSATGRYADYVADEILPMLLARYASPGGNGHGPIVAGHSSGGYGALLLAMSRHQTFPDVVALSPDSDFETTHKPLVQQPSVQDITAGELRDAMTTSRPVHLPSDGMARLIMGLCANYTPKEGRPGRFDWLYDGQGGWRPDVWQRWLSQDPYVIARDRPDAFAQSQRVYLDGAEHDEFGANIGARKIFHELQSNSTAVEFYESPGHHADHLAERLARGVTWVVKSVPERTAP